MAEGLFLEFMTVSLCSLRIFLNSRFSTINKFRSRIGSSLFTRLLNRCMRHFYERCDRISCTAIDSSGFNSSYVSHYYSWRSDMMRKCFLQTSNFVDLAHQIISGFKIPQQPVQISLMLKNSGNNATESNNLTYISWTEGTTPEISTG